VFLLSAIASCIIGVGLFRIEPLLGVMTWAAAGWLAHMHDKNQRIDELAIESIFCLGLLGMVIGFASLMVAILIL